MKAKTKVIHRELGKPFIPEMTDSDFLAFLYSERDRENDINQFQGWNAWALIGAIIASLCAAYTFVFDNSPLDWMRVMYYASGAIALFLTYHTWLIFLNRDRGHDPSRVRLLKEMAPWADAILAISTAICACVLILVYDSSSLLFWLWVITLVAQVLVTLIAVLSKNRLVPFYFYRPFTPKSGWNIAIDALFGGLLCMVWQESFRTASWNILNPEFEIGICFGAVIVLIYYLIRINTENKTVKQFDAILDRYLYARASKEKTYQTILCNRMGYGVLEVCQDDLSRVLKMTSDCEQKGEELDELKAKIQSGQYELSQIPAYFKHVSHLPNYLQQAMHYSKRLSRRLDEIVRMAPVLDQVEDIEQVFEANQQLYDVVNIVMEKIDVVYSLVRAKNDEYNCNKSNLFCSQTDCDHKIDEMD